MRNSYDTKKKKKTVQNIHLNWPGGLKIKDKHVKSDFDFF